MAKKNKSTETAPQYETCAHCGKKDVKKGYMSAHLRYCHPYKKEQKALVTEDIRANRMEALLDRAKSKEKQYHNHSIDVDYGHEELAGPSHDALARICDDQLLYNQTRASLMRGIEVVAPAEVSALDEEAPAAPLLALEQDDLNIFPMPSPGGSEVSAIEAMQLDREQLAEFDRQLEEEEQSLRLSDDQSLPTLVTDSEENVTSAGTTPSPQEALSYLTQECDSEWTKILWHPEPGKKRERDPFHPDNFDERETDLYVHRPVPEEPPAATDSMYAQLDLLLLLRKAKCPLYLHDDIIDWMKLHSKRSIQKMSTQSQEGARKSSLESEDHVFHPDNLLKRKALLASLSSTFGTTSRRPKVQNIELPSDHRLISFTKFSFVHEFMSIFTDKDLMKEENLVDGYDIKTGLREDGSRFWNPETIKANNFLQIPTPTDPSRPISHLYCGTKHQLSRDRFCNREHHMPVPLIFFYDEAHLDRNGFLTNAPMFGTCGWFKHSCRARMSFWRIFGIVPHLGLGSGKSSSKSPEEKSIDHHAVLRSLFGELEEICKRGGLRVEYKGEKVLLKFWIHFIIGDTKGHNQLCGSFEKSTSEFPMRECLCHGKSLNVLPLQCKAVTTDLIEGRRDITKTDRDEMRKDPRLSETDIIRRRLDTIGYRITDICFDHLPMGHPTRGIRGCCPFETLHVMDQGVIKYLTESLWDVMYGYKQDREKFDHLFRAMSRYMERQSETDMARRCNKVEVTDNTRLSGRERIGNLMCLLVCLHTKDGEIALTRSVETPLLGRMEKSKKKKKQKKKSGQKRSTSQSNTKASKGKKSVQASRAKNAGAKDTKSTVPIKLSISKIRTALEYVLTFERWVLQSDNTAQEVKLSVAHVNDALQTMMDALPRIVGCGWSFPKLHGAATFPFQIVEDGPGEGWTGSHGESFHTQVTNGAASLTQKRTDSLVKQLGDRIHENLTMDAAALRSGGRLSPSTKRTFDSQRTHNKDGAGMKLLPRERRTYNRTFDNEEVYKYKQWGSYEMIVPPRSAVLAKTQTAKIKWLDHRRQQTKPQLWNILMYALSSYAASFRFMQGFTVTGFTTVSKVDHTTGENVKYRADPHLMGDKWQDWCLVNWHHEGVFPCLILGFVRFETDRFPTEARRRTMEHEDFNNTQENRDAVLLDKDVRVYAVVRSSQESLEEMGYDRHFIPKFQLRGENSVFFVQMEEIVGPAMVVPYVNTHEQYRFHQDKGHWLLIRPMRLWGDWFGSKIGSGTVTTCNYVVPEIEVPEIEDEDASVEGSDNESTASGVEDDEDEMTETEQQRAPSPPRRTSGRNTKRPITEV